MAVHHITVNLNEEEEAFVKWLRAYDREHHAIRYTANQELAMMLGVELREMMDLFEEERKAWQEQNTKH